jgi:hypothetical protein
MPHNKALHQTGRGGVASFLRRRPVVEARPAGEGRCSLYQARSPMELTTARIGWTRQS